MKPVEMWRRAHHALRTDRSDEPIPLIRNYALQCAYAGHAFMFLGLVLLVFLQPAGLGLILFGLIGYAVCAFYYFDAPRWR
jgi:hypothetical protein